METAKSGDEISEEGRQQRFARWEQFGLDQVKRDLESGGQTPTARMPR
jgi:hypothetical protein